MIPSQSVFFQTRKKCPKLYLDPFGPWNRDDILPLSEEPRKRDLSRGCFMFLAQFLKTIDQLQNTWKVISVSIG